MGCCMGKPLQKTAIPAYLRVEPIVLQAPQAILSDSGVKSAPSSIPKPDIDDSQQNAFLSTGSGLHHTHESLHAQPLEGNIVEIPLLVNVQTNEACTESVNGSKSNMVMIKFHEISTDRLTADDHILDISKTATPRRYRLLDCTSLIENNTLCLHEFEHFPDVPYCAISYVWRGNLPNAVFSSPQANFIVRGAEDGDPFSLDALRHVCVAALQKQCQYLWLDRLCIIQTSREDKAWQISNMFEIYRSCQLCLVLPGGIGRLAAIDEETTWIHRAWTLQEVLAPNSRSTLISVVFSWIHGPTEIGGPGGPCTIEQVVPGVSAITPLRDLLRISFAAKRWVTKGDRFLWITPNIFGVRSRRQVLTLIGAMDEQNPDARAQAVWRSVLMRTSSRPVDMVFSIMGIFGVILPVKEFHENDRILATVALAKEILQQGGKAHWLGASFKLPPCRQLSSFPILPRTSVAVIPRVQMEEGRLEVAEAIDHPNYNRWIDGVPGGTMDVDGYLSCNVRSVPLRPTRYRQDFVSKSLFTSGDGLGRLLIKGMDLGVWEITDDTETPCYCTILNGTFDEESTSMIINSHVELHRKPAQVIQNTGRLERSRLYAVFVGRATHYSDSVPALGQDFARKSLRAVLVEEHAPGRFHRTTTYFEIEDDFLPFVEEWPRRDIDIGGPAVPLKSGVELDESESEEPMRTNVVGGVYTINPRNILFEPPVVNVRVNLDLEDSDKDEALVCIGLKGS
ncbi:hypothetical protein D9757_011551 [Collybiopsis confluens]|uniref:Heterokaryon incompatibility domain-containing protein n=1 Tax=Collybiopsis confluens TaxID=2823264 RepID=A0A8H5GAS4_9AGAR|nr:hypothetical protein D9757_011551 [Collybiopsis confluens]